MSISRLAIHNFQAHKRLVLNLDPQVTVIVGPTDAGKSSVLRALRWLCLNEAPRGDFIHWGETSARVTATIDGHLLSRMRDKSGNHYKLDEADLKAFGVNVPSQVENLLRMTEKNFQGQIDPPFWLTSAGGQLAKELNRIVDLGLIDTSLGNISTENRKAKSELDVIQKRTSEAQAKVAELSWVPEMRKDLASLEEIDRDLSEKREVRSRIAAAIEAVQTLTETISSSASAMPALAKLIEIGDRLEAVRDNERELSNLIERIASTEDENKCLERNAKLACQALKEASRGKCPICGRTQP